MVPEEHDVNVSAQPDVERQIPADVVGVVVNHNLVAVPHPVIAEADVIGCDAEIETAEPEAAGASADQMPYVVPANSARKVAVRPGVIEMVIAVSRTGIVPDPFTVRVDVRSIGVPGCIVIMSRLRSGCLMGSGRRFLRAMGGYMSTRCAPVLFTLALTMLGPGRN